MLVVLCVHLVSFWGVFIFNDRLLLATELGFYFESLS